MKENYEPIISCETMTSLTTPGKILQDVNDYSIFSQKNHQANKLCNVPVGESDMVRTSVRHGLITFYSDYN